MPTNEEQYMNQMLLHRATNVDITPQERKERIEAAHASFDNCLKAAVTYAYTAGRMLTEAIENHDWQQLGHENRTAYLDSFAFNRSTAYRYMWAYEESEKQGRIIGVREAIALRSEQQEDDDGEISVGGNDGQGGGEHSLEGSGHTRPVQSRSPAAHPGTGDGSPEGTGEVDEATETTMSSMPQLPTETAGMGDMEGEPPAAPDKGEVDGDVLGQDAEGDGGEEGGPGNGEVGEEMGEGTRPIQDDAPPHLHLLPESKGRVIDAEKVVRLCLDCGSKNISNMFVGLPAFISELKMELPRAQNVAWKDHWEERLIQAYHANNWDDDTCMTVAHALIGWNLKYKDYASTFMNWYKREASGQGNNGRPNRTEAPDREAWRGRKEW